jgi:hypothetical protein
MSALFSTPLRYVTGRDGPGRISFVRMGAFSIVACLGGNRGPQVFCVSANRRLTSVVADRLKARPRQCTAGAFRTPRLLGAAVLVRSAQAAVVTFASCPNDSDEHGNPDEFPDRFRTLLPYQSIEHLYILRRDATCRKAVCTP